jgi:hypothetical protein
MAYRILVDANHEDFPSFDGLTAAIEEAVGYLGEALE